MPSFFKIRLFYQGFSRHFFRLREFHHIQKRRCKICKDTVVAQRNVFVFFRNQNYGYGVGRVLGKRHCSVVGDHLVGVSVVCRHQRATTHCKDFIRHLLDAFVYRVYRLYRRIHHTCMSNHITVCKVQNNDVVNAFVEFFQNFFGDGIRAHFRLQVVGGYFRGRDYDTCFAFDGRF